MRALCDHLGVARCKAVGLSMGGNTLLHLATQHPDLLEAMVLIGAPSYFPAQARAIMRTFTLETRSEPEWAAMRARHAHGDDQIRALWRIAVGFADSYDDDMAFTPPHLATIRARTLIVIGDRDELYPVEIFVEQYRAIPGAALYVIPGAGHDAVFGAARPEFVRAALAFPRTGSPPSPAKRERAAALAESRVECGTVMVMFTFVTGGLRSGKSEYALRRASELGPPPWLYVAAAHRRRRRAEGAAGPPPARSGSGVEADGGAAQDRHRAATPARWRATGRRCSIASRCGCRTGSRSRKPTPTTT